ncbi:acyltransferase family protein [Nocardioides psychrotolerans]|uniref:acyltransferase family protein n=1 Tax=Nocardioides psychrotolerans TaxID=1005945 RepID=UPI0031382B3F
MDPTSATPQPRKQGFRQDVQGLRAVAVLTVLAAHAGVAFLPGGYVGVDVFFVISGFLITQLLVTEASRSGRVSLSGFYARRARRILPAASVVLVATVAASVLWMSVLEAIDLAKDALWSAVFAANVRFAQQGVDYFAAEAAPSPLQHYWSLAVEEQFYLVWPLLVGAVAWVVARRRATAGRPDSVLRGLVVAIVAIGLASFVWSLVRTGAEPQSAYFSTFTRAWELAVGAGVALAVQAGRTLRHRRGAEVLVWGGLASILVACVAFDETLAFPGYAAALPVLGTAAVLYAGAHAGVTTSAGRLLSLRPMRAVGDWSYSLYLWHWPLLIVPPTALGRDLRPLEVVLLVALAFELAYLTYRFVEQPFRTRRVSSVRPRRALILYPVFLGLVGSTAGAGWAWSDYRVSEHGDSPAVTTSQFGITDDGPDALVRASVLAAQARQATPSDLTPDLVDLEDDLADVGDCLYEGGTTWELCPRGDDDGDKTLVVIGDSHARAWIPAFDQIAERSGYRAFYLVKAQCSAALVDPSEAFTGDPWPECEEFHRWTEEQIGELDPDLVVMTSSAPITGLYSEGRRLRSMDDIAGELGVGLADMFRAYTPLTDRLVMLVDVPRLSLDPGVCLSTFGSDLGDCAQPPDATGVRMRDLTVDVATEAGVEVVDPETWFCADGLCPTVVGSTISYRDRGHITSTRAAELAEPLGTALGIW